MKRLNDATWYHATGWERTIRCWAFAVVSTDIYFAIRPIELVQSVDEL